MNPVELRLLRALWQNKGRTKPRDERTEVVHARDGFILATDGVTCTIAPNYPALEPGAWDGKVSLSSFEGVMRADMGSNLAELIPVVKRATATHTLLLSRTGLYNAIRGMNSDDLKLEIRHSEENGWDYLVIYGAVEDKDDTEEVITIPLISVVAQKEQGEETLPEWFPSEEK